MLEKKYACSEIFPRGNILADSEKIIKTRGFFPTRIFPFTVKNKKKVYIGNRAGAKSSQSVTSHFIEIQAKKLNKQSDVKVRKKRITRGWSHRERHQQNISFDCNDILMEGFVFSELNAQTFSAEFHFPHVLLCLADSNLLPMKLIGTSGPQFETVPRRVEHLNRSPVPLRISIKWEVTDWELLAPALFPM